MIMLNFVNLLCTSLDLKKEQLNFHQGIDNFLTITIIYCVTIDEI